MPKFVGFRIIFFQFQIIESSYRGGQSLLVKEIRVLRENHRPVISHSQTLSHNVVSSAPCPNGIRTHNGSGDRTDCTGNCKSMQLTYLSPPRPLTIWEMISFRFHS
jgi:hypothetical protein